MKHMRNEQNGFTLIELLIVMVVLAILAAIAIPSYLNQRNKAKDAAVKEGVHSLQVGIQSYALDHSDTYPSSLTPSTLTDQSGKAYVDQWPKNPYTNSSMASSSNAGDYTYTPASSSYSLQGHLANGLQFTVP